jgi:RNA polymerase sigma-70 factor, ECF subfamily
MTSYYTYKMQQTLNYTEIYNEYSPRILRYLNCTFCIEDAEDLLQEIFIKVYNSLDTFRNESSVNTWIYKIAKNAIIDKLKSRNYKFYKAQEELNATKINYDNSHFVTTFDRKIEKEEMYVCIRKFIGNLTENNRTVFVLSQYEGLSNAEIAEILQIIIDSVKIRLHRAKESLINSLKKNCNIYFDNSNEISCEPK